MSKSKIEKDIMEKVKQGEIKMTPKYLFEAKKISLKSALGILLIISIVSINLSLYTFSQNYRVVGIPGANLLLQSFPYTYVFISLATLILFNIIWKTFDISYKERYKHLMPILIGLAIIIGFLIWKTQANEKIQERFPRHQMINKMYQGNGMMRNRY